MPSRFAPTRARRWVPDVGPLASITSVRVICTFTGRRALRDSSAAIGSM